MSKKYKHIHRDYDGKVVKIEYSNDPVPSSIYSDYSDYSDYSKNNAISEVDNSEKKCAIPDCPFSSSAPYFYTCCSCKKSWCDQHKWLGKKTRRENSITSTVACPVHGGPLCNDCGQSNVCSICHRPLTIQHILLWGEEEERNKQIGFVQEFFEKYFSWMFEL